MNGRIDIQLFSQRFFQLCHFLVSRLKWNGILKLHMKGHLRIGAIAMDMHMMDIVFVSDDSIRNFIYAINHFLIWFLSDQRVDGLLNNIECRVKYQQGNNNTQDTINPLRGFL